MKENITEYHIPRWEELPNIDLYLDQIVSVLEDYLKPYIRKEEEKILTKTMINNYVKQGILESPIKKKYNKKHIAYLFVICILKQVYSINDISELIKFAVKSYTIKEAYNRFCIELEKAISCIFKHTEYNYENNLTYQGYILKNVVFSFANKLYVEKNYLYNEKDKK